MDMEAPAERVDLQLFEIQEKYDLLRLLQPTNLSEAWESFRSSGFEREPEFRYPQLNVDPASLRADLENVEVSDVEDAALLYFLRAKRDELELELTLLDSRDTGAFLAASIRLFGPVQQELLSEAGTLLDTLDPEDGPAPGDTLSTEACRRLVEEELEHYRSRDPSFDARLRVRDDQEGFLASEGDLYFPAEIELPENRARALIQHEVGVHLLTYHNGGKQPLRLLRSGLSSYDELQEAFGALAEYFSGALTATRMRTLAARALAARMTEQRAHFVDVFRRLTRDHGFSDSAAFHIVARVHQAGGFTRDQIYLRGLIYLLRYLRAGGEIEPLYLGKLGHAEIPILHDLRRRGVLREPPLRPRFLEMEGSNRRLQRLREGLSPVDLVLQPES